MSEDSASPGDPKDSAILDLLSESGVVVRPTVTKLVRGNGNAAMLFCQVMWLSNQQTDPADWFECTNAVIARGTGLSKDSIAHAFDALAKLGLVEEQAQQGSPRRVRINHRRLLKLLLALPKYNKPSPVSPPESSENQPAGHVPPPLAGHVPPPLAGHVPPVSYRENIRTLETPSASPAPQKRTGHRKPPRGHFPSSTTVRGMLCPEDFKPDERARSWAAKKLPPATLARLDSLTEQFVRKHREVVRDYLPDAAAWQASWQNFMQACGDNDARSARTGVGNGRGPVALDDGPSYDDLVEAGTMPALV